MIMGFMNGDTQCLPVRLRHWASDFQNLAFRHIHLVTRKGAIVLEQVKDFGDMRYRIREEQNDVIGEHRQLDDVSVNLDPPKEVCILQMPSQRFNRDVKEEGREGTTL